VNSPALKVAGRRRRPHRRPRSEGQRTIVGKEIGAHVLVVGKQNGFVKPPIANRAGSLGTPASPPAIVGRFAGILPALPLHAAYTQALRAFNATSLSTGTGALGDGLEAPPPC